MDFRVTCGRTRKLNKSCLDARKESCGKSLASDCNWDYLTRLAMNILVKDISRAATKRYLPICPSGYLSVYPHLSIYPSIHPCIFPPTLLSIYACIHPSVYCSGNSLKKKLVRGFEAHPTPMLTSPCSACSACLTCVACLVGDPVVLLRIVIIHGRTWTLGSGGKGQEHSQLFFT